MQRRRKKILLSHVLGLTAVGLVALCVIWFGRTDGRMFSRRDFRGMDLYIQNNSCETIFDFRTVSDAELYAEAVALCCKAQKYRPYYTHWDLILGCPPQPSPILEFRDNAGNCSISLLPACEQIAVEEKLSAGNINAKNPIVYMYKSASGESWFCTMPAQDYVRLFQLVQDYSGGEMVDISAESPEEDYAAEK